MNTNYRHTQMGWVTSIAMLGGAPLLIALFIFLPGSRDTRAPAFVTAVILAACGLLFGSLTVEVDAKVLSWRFGPGLFRKSVEIQDIKTATPVRNTWMHGWGIHLTRDGWVYNVSGYGAVEVMMKSGKRFRLGTDEPEKLAHAINESVFQIT
jgi:hypothetical protein